jgi:hypothetical protein
VQGLPLADPIGYQTGENPDRRKQEADKHPPASVPAANVNTVELREGKTKVLTSRRAKESRSVDP